MARIALTQTVVDIGTQIEHIPMGWGGKHGTPAQPVASDVGAKWMDSRIIMGANATPVILASPAIDDASANKRKPEEGTDHGSIWRRRLSVNEMCMSPKLRMTGKGIDRVRSITWNESLAQPRVKKTPKYRKNKKATKVEPNQPLISDSFPCTPTRSETVKDDLSS